MAELRIVLPEYLVSDGQETIPRVGDRVEYLLEFREIDPAVFPEASHVVETRAEHVPAAGNAHADADRRILAHHDGRRHLLRGSHWAASLASQTLDSVPAELVGIFEVACLGMVTEHARAAGEVTDCMLITRTSWPDTDGEYSHDGTMKLSPLRVGQSGFDSGLVADVPDNFHGSGWFPLVPPRDGPWRCEEGALVTLDVDGSAPQ
ncbi:hypothetical protein [Tomitella fengzijianii]|uniref:Uncharacterized protein n=1 Tax=Tomitella fengzijianii TaxID=2597660 RepID=A0A516X132_9ACTN|nr:hypothetical protein [Tomitella fengzijianii]QDQ96778.1 hypothetical protein FO059_04745 [Tomitella fengzijianii]